MKQRLYSLKRRLEVAMEDNLRCNAQYATNFTSTPLECRHTFCLDCIEKWRKEKKSCPICRKPVKKTTKPIAFQEIIDAMVEDLRFIEPKENRKNLPGALSHEPDSKAGNQREKNLVTTFM